MAQPPFCVKNMDRQILIVTEKPSAAKSIAAALGISRKKKGYFEGGGYTVAWCIGHLVVPAPPERYGEQWKKWSRESLPLLPGHWKYEVKKETGAQYEILAELFRSADEIVNACDAGREGELIFRLAYEMAGCTKPVRRLWLSSMEENAIREGLADAAPSSRYDSLYQSALCRQRADWLVGINGTRLFTTLYGGRILKVGKVQTPVLAMVTGREKEITGFKRTPYYFIDDGFSGVSFDRPAFREMIAEIEKGNINCVITKDLSRLGRNYLETGVYIEMFFPEHHVRYIAINDAVDTMEQESADFTPFRNIINELYAKDTSKKVKSAKRARFLDGMYISTSAPYGYKKDPDNRHRLVVDERYAPTVRMIFSLAKDGMGILQIRNYINSRHILRPSAVNPNGYGRYFNGEDDPKRFEWSNNSVRGILRNPVYAGHLVMGKRIRPSFKSHKSFSVLPENYKVVRDVHQPIVDPEDFELVQRMITSRRSNKDKPRRLDNIFAGLIKCADCGYAMTLAKANRSPKEEVIDEYGYMCNNYKTFGKSVDTSHWIEARQLYDCVLADIRKHAADALADNDELCRKLAGQIGTDKAKQEKTLEKELRAKKARLSEVDNLFQSIYEDKLNGKISERNYQMMSRRYEEEQASLEQAISEMKKQWEESGREKNNIEQFTRIIKDYAGIEELSAALLNTLIEKVTVGEPKEVNGERIQEVKIYYKFIGNIS